MKFTRVALIVAILFSGSIFGQKAQEIRGIAKEVKSAAFYKEQIELWKAETQKDPKDAHAWHMLYSATRAYTQKSDYQAWLKSRSDVFAKLRPVIDDAKKHIDGTYEYYLMEAINTDSKKSIEFTLKAYAIDPTSVDTYESLLIHHIVTGNEEKATEVSKLMLACNYYSNANYKWNYNALQTSEKEGIYITQGDNDSMPRWILQYGLGLRKDVAVLNIWLLNMYDDYRKATFERLGIEPMTKKRSEYANESEFVNAIMIHILKTSKKPAYVGCGIDVSVFKQGGIYENMYLVGTAFQYCNYKMDNLALVKKNFEQNYELEYLFNEFQVHSEDELVRLHMNLTYIPGIMKLKHHYALAGDKAKEGYYQELFEKIARDSGREDEIKSWYN